MSAKQTSTTTVNPYGFANLDDPWGGRCAWEVSPTNAVMDDPPAKAQSDTEPEPTEEVSETVSNDSWEDMTHRNKWEWLDRIETGYNLTNNAFRVAHALAGYGGSNNTKGIFPNHKTLAAKTEQSVGNVKKGLTELETKDLIRKVGGGRGHAVRYAIGVPG
ncbi:helix-turn-helix domain-containing protein [Streptomyces sp. PDY-4]|uniref:helix-turn-helix domain-containing protein n=1 Tax=Streptomyces sp. PDY-4 TaxID=3376070 RepID=UPI0037BCEE61